MVKGVGHFDHVEAMEAGGRAFEPRPMHYSRMSFYPNRQLVRFSHPNMPFFPNYAYIIWNGVFVGKHDITDHPRLPLGNYYFGHVILIT